LIAIKELKSATRSLSTRFKAANKTVHRNKALQTIPSRN
jgi:hypothetical protein